MVIVIPTKPSNVTWTDDQWKAIHAAGQDVLVAAAAGSGKTAVLIERLITKITTDGPERVNVDELLVVTFTNAAAAEMRARMAAALEKAIMELDEEDDRDPVVREKKKRLRKQLSLIGKAQISTLHSFCLTICRQYAYMTDLDPGFRIATTDEIALLKDDVLATVLETAYKGEAETITVEEMYTLVDSFTSDRNDVQIESLVEKLYEMARVQPEPYKWMRSILQQYELPENITIDELDFVPELKTSIIHSLKEAQDHLISMGKIASQDEGLAIYGPVAAEEAGFIAVAIDRLENGTWQEAADHIRQVKWARMPSTKKGTFDERLKELATGHRDSAKKIVNDLKETYFLRDGHHLVDEIRRMKPIIASLTELTILFSEAFKEAKLERGIVDFSDLEHYALEILTVRDESDMLKPSAVADDYRKQFKEVLVDEYQDVNLLQETILQLVKNGDETNGNMFMVGDVKQSIYAFRLAEPRLFLEKYARFQAEPEGTGMRIDLNRNFRSRSEVLGATNYVFEQIMDEEVGEIAYDDRASLKYGEGYDADAKPVEVELVVFNEKGSSSTNSSASGFIDGAGDEADEESLEKSIREARYMIKRINEMVNGGFMVFNAKDGSKRPLQYSDIVILMRSMRWAGDLAEEFKAAGIPLYADSSKGYFDALEVMIMMNLLKVIDNPYQDIPLVSVLRAPFVGLTESELATVRLAKPRVTYYEAVQEGLSNVEASGLNFETVKKLETFMAQLQEWRHMARRGSLADLIWDIYLKTNYFEMVGAMSNGKQRQANLRALHDRAIAYEKSSFRGLFRFLRFIDRMQSRGDDLGVAKSIGEADNVVRLVTIHSSKGLEYPVVFVAGMSGKFNMQDFYGSYIFDQDFGLAVKAIDPENRVVTTSLPFLALKEKKIAKMKAEEMRILYVAMTRAKEKLILMGAVKDWEKTKQKWEQYQNLDGPRLPGYVRARANSYLDWVGAAVARHEDFYTLTYQDEEPEAEVLKHGLWKVKVLSDTVLLGEATEAQEEQPVVREEPNPTFVTELKHRFNYEYPHLEATKVKSKTSVSEIKRLEALAMADGIDMDSKPLNMAVKKSSSLKRRPLFMQDRQMTRAEIGTAVHAIMQHVPQEGFTSVDAAEVFKHQLVSKEILRQVEADAVNMADVMRFFDSSIGQRFKTAVTVLREVPFTLSRTNADGVPQIMQGVIDCVFEDATGRWVLLDYKTDAIRPPFHEEPQLTEEMTQRYGLQLELYRDALAKIKHIEVNEKVLYLYEIGTSIELK